ncbi:glycosyltransferase family 39 protein [Myxococcus sp. MISCRS1]|jgi:4-amino-4-deoxy-L-arabinose transferase-like glycosyltransferase|uniref:ArnT family glycosyltransferase n=1 Tax=unclassified Myxococcus TaxID=2648731 RepID=UPI001CBDE305|nr:MULTISPECIES: glycosyltransferase family 39 protein [unclassified Myxococcus]MBZ4412394.1 glycosyltransferase family 39 protein [Myxococcus sp. XM-1-1-1]MCY0996155.1 glycosyltransferase family 39 protein [Myxococcus sp. MISCRS1]
MRRFVVSARELWQRHPVALGVAVTFSLSLLLRWLYLQSAPDRAWPFSIFFYGDSRFFHTYALEHARGLESSATLPYHPPLFPWLLGLLYRVLGEPQGNAYPYKLCLAALSASTVALSWTWWRGLLGTAWSFVAAGLFAASFGWLVLSTTYSNEVLYAFFLTATLALVLRHRAGPTPVGAVLLGLAMGLGSLTRAEHLYLWPFLLAWAWLYRGSTPLTSLATRWGAAVLVSALVLAPWALRNARVLQELNASTPALEPLPVMAPVTVYGPINFAMANHAGATGGFTPDSVNQLGQDGHLDVANTAQRHLLLHGYAVGLAWMREHPADAARLWSAKLGRWLDGLSLGLGASNLPSGLSGSRAPVDLFVPEGGALKWPLVALLVAGVLLSVTPRWRAFSLLSLVVLHRALITAAFFGYTRGLLTIFPALLPLLLLPLVALTARRPALALRVPAVAGVLLLLLWVEAGALALGAPRGFMASGSTDRTSGKLIQDDWVRIWPK